MAKFSKDASRESVPGLQSDYALLVRHTELLSIHSAASHTLSSRSPNSQVMYNMQHTLQRRAPHTLLATTGWINRYPYSSRQLTLRSPVPAALGPVSRMRNRRQAAAVPGRPGTGQDANCPGSASVLSRSWQRRSTHGPPGSSQPCAQATKAPRGLGEALRTWRRPTPCAAVCGPASVHVGRTHRRRRWMPRRASHSCSEDRCCAQGCQHEWHRYQLS